jgi:formylglycine-generating enzyme required for sulfatase activity
MHGNVWEWCEGDWHKNYINVPVNGSALISQSQYKLLRGGSWNINPVHCRSAFRDNYDLVTFNDYIGFRVVCSGAART